MYLNSVVGSKGLLFLFQDEVQCLVDFLAQPNVVSILDLSSTDIPSEVLFSALVRGCTQHLSHLNLARNPFLTKKSKGEFVSTSFEKYGPKFFSDI